MHQGWIRATAVAVMTMACATAFAGTISLQPSQASYAVGETVIFQVMDSSAIDACDLSIGACGADFSFTYNAAALRYVSAVEGSADVFLIGQPVLPGDPDPAGSFGAQVVFLPDTAPSTPSTLLEIRFTALAPAASTALALSVPAGGAYGSLIDPPISAAGNVAITAVPEPATWLLSLAGLAALAGFAQRRRAVPAPIRAI